MSNFLLGCIGKVEDKINHIKKYRFSRNIKKEIVLFIDQVKRIKDEMKI